MQHHDTHEDRMLDLVADNADPRAAFAESDLAACSTCRGLLEEYADLSSALDEAGHETRKSVALAESVRAAPGEELVDEVLRPLLEGGSPEDASEVRPTRVPWLSVLAAVAAAALLIQFFLYDPFATPDESYGAESLSGETGMTLTQPIGRVPSWGGFGWEAELPDEGWFTLRIGDLERGVLHQSDALRAHGWIPEPSVVATWPDHIRWEVRLFDASGEELDSAYGEAWLAKD